MTKVVLNEQHQLMEDQKRILDERFGNDWSLFPIPANGLTLEDMNKIVLDWQEQDNNGELHRIVFASPVPALIMYAARGIGDTRVHVLHNDNREKKELPGGKIIMTVAKEGWQIV